MGRCRHGFDFDCVVCPSGCGGTRKQQRQVATGQRLPEARKERRTKAPTSTFTDEELATVLESAPSLRTAAGRLGCSQTTLYTRSKRTKELRALHDGAAERGRETSRRLQGIKTRKAVVSG